MTTWELATAAEKQTIRAMIEKLQRADRPLPPFPATAAAPDLANLTKRDAGTLTTLLREALRD
jgi:hypothetical protein